MTAREYAKKCGIEIVGKLKKKVVKTTKFDWKKGEEKEVSTVYYTDEAGTEISGNKKDGWCIVTVDGDVI